MNLYIYKSVYTMQLSRMQLTCDGRFKICWLGKYKDRKKLKSVQQCFSNNRLHSTFRSVSKMNVWTDVNRINKRKQNSVIGRTVLKMDFWKVKPSKNLASVFHLGVSSYSAHGTMQKVLREMAEIIARDTPGRNRVLITNAPWKYKQML